MIDDFFAAITLGFFLAFMIGPVFFVLLETSAIKGVRAAIALDLGVVFSDIVFILIAYLSANQLLEKLKDDPALFVFGGVILVTYGVVSLIKNKKFIQQRDQDPTIQLIKKNNYFRLFAKGFLLNFINIGVLGFWLGIIIVFGPQLEMKTERIIGFFTAVLGSYFIIDLGKIFLAKRLNSSLTPHRIYRLKKFIGFLIIVFGVFLLLKGAVPEEINNKIENRIERQINN